MRAALTVVWIVVGVLAVIVLAPMAWDSLIPTVEPSKPSKPKPSDIPPQLLEHLNTVRFHWSRFNADGICDTEETKSRFRTRYERIHGEAAVAAMLAAECGPQ